MFDAIKKMYQLRKNEIFIIEILLVAGCILAGGGIDFLIYHGNTEDKIYPIATMLLMAVWVVYIIMMIGMGMCETFNQCVGMGMTRKRFMQSYLALNMLHGVIGFLSIVVIGFAERAFLMTCIHGKEYPDIAGVLFTGMGLTVTISIVFFIIAMAMFAGLMITKYGKSAAFPIWIIWMALCILPGRISKAREQADGSILASIGNGIEDIITNISLSHWAVIFLSISLLLYWIEFRIALKQEVRA